MSLHQRKILFVSGTRAEFGKMKSIIAEVRDAPDFDYQLFVTGMHMLARYGSTYREIQRAGFDNVFYYINQDGAVNSQMDLVLASTIQGLGLFIREFPADMIVVHGDRIEALAGAVVGALNNILVAHVEGGEVSGTVDELLRHAISKLSHIHLVSNAQARDRLIQMGERAESIHVVGSPGVDTMLSTSLPSLEEVRERYEIPFDHYGIFVYHPVTTELHTLKAHIREVIRALCASEMNYVIIHPNNDTGRDVISEEIENLRNSPHFRILPSMRFEHYLTLLKNAIVLVGNSSSGIHEAPVYGVPTIDIGTRQLNRLQHSTVINVPEESDAILHALSHLPNRERSLELYGAGNSSQLFLDLLRSEVVWSTPQQKHFCDVT
jgi:UDP-N-acetylglucosamine 2-epimerase (hydrolysing)